MTRSGNQEDSSVLCDRMGMGERPNRRSVDIHELRFQPYGPSLGKTAGHFSLKSARNVPTFSGRDDSGVGEVIQSSRVVMMEMGQDYRRDIPRRIQTYFLQPESNLFKWRYLNDDFLREEGFHQGRYPGTELRAVSPVSTRNRPSGCSTRKAKIGTGPYHVRSRNISILRPMPDRPSRPRCCADFMRAVPV